ncbi:nuclear pore complex protein Nup107-like isoform X2 [Stegodyphus dumicola]|nr:nuclear pore complex protein Nup107-like isoform X2 [Stegodyphus dumicola]XP_035222944.1 nuclear pore complex protein Nup107-like isoform X2 [Stegodyphus dumicola]
MTIDTTLAQLSDQSMSFINPENPVSSDISGIYEIDSRFQDTPKMDLTDASRGDFDTAVILNADAGALYADFLYEEFLDFFLSYAGEHEIFNLLLNYEELCCKGIEKLQEILVKRTSVETKLQKTSCMLRFLQEERNTWRLLRTLFKDRLETEITEEGDITMYPLGKKISDKQIVENIYQKDSYIRQSQLIVDWLEKNAADDFRDMFFDKFEYFTDNCLALEHSLNELTSNINLSKNKENLMFEMDPDAPFRQESYPVHEADKENEARLFKFMFICIRSGKLDDAQQLAERFGEPWLAAALEGWRLFHDPNYDNEVMEGQELQPVEGNKYRDLWKAACWMASQAPVVPVYEQAVYGSVCGNLKALIPVCHTWEDFLWTYMRTSLDKRIEDELQSSAYQQRALEEMPAEYWDKTLDFAEIFQELETNDSRVKLNCNSSHHVIQKYIILNDLDGLIEEMYNWLSNIQLQGHVLRCMAHIILFLRVIGKSTKEELCIPILEAYVQELIKSRKVSLVAPYTSTLPKQQQIMWYAKFLEGVTDNAERQKCLQYAEDAGLDVPEITKTVVRNIREKESDRTETFTDLSVLTTAEDLQKINSIDWLIFDPTQRAEAVKQANALMRIFIVQRKIEAAKAVFSKVPPDSVGVMVQLSKAKGLEELSDDDDNATREYLCFKAYLEAMDAFSSWFHHSVQAKPKEPQPPSGENVTFKQKVAYEHEMQQYKKDLERWHTVVASLGLNAAECFYNVLLFVSGGWMVDQRTDGTPDENRQLQLSHLRKFCIPQVTQLLQELLHSENRFKEALQLADIIASERYQLYKEFTSEALKDFLRATLFSSFALLNQKLDPLGYEYQENL